MTEQLTFDDALELRVDPEHTIRTGDVCSQCRTTVRARWSGIACDCGRLWDCA